MTQGQHIMAGVRAATRRYYGSKRKGQGRRWVGSLHEGGRAVLAAGDAIKNWVDALLSAIKGGQKQ